MRTDSAQVSTMQLYMIYDSRTREFGQEIQEQPKFQWNNKIPQIPAKSYIIHDFRPDMLSQLIG